ncbi:MAG TPA: hypothetical protein PLS66_05455 [Tepiditoga sp.]|nr:hypothetical protein [Tepiditoga sp.]HOO74717.1 hypothetical protein [Tepiditoga sp.]
MKKRIIFIAVIILVIISLVSCQSAESNIAEALKNQTEIIENLIDITTELRIGYYFIIPISLIAGVVIGKNNKNKNKDKGGEKDA